MPASRRPMLGSGQCFRTVSKPPWMLVVYLQSKAQPVALAQILHALAGVITGRLVRLYYLVVASGADHAV